MIIKRLLKITALVITFCALVTAFAILYVQFRYIGNMYSVDAAPKKPTAIILGASVTKAGEPSDALRDRIQTGVDLYRAGKVEALFMTGDDGAFHIDEIAVMAQTAGHSTCAAPLAWKLKELWQINSTMSALPGFGCGTFYPVRRHFGMCMCRYQCLRYVGKMPMFKDENETPPRTNSAGA